MVWDCKYHLVWTAKYRYQTLGGDVGHLCRELIYEIAISKAILIYAVSIYRDHVHMLIGIPPQLSASRAAQYLNVKSSHRLLSEYKTPRKRYWSPHLQASGYWAASSGNVTDEVWKESSRTSGPWSQMMILLSYNDGHLPNGRSIRLSGVSRCHQL